MSQRFLAVHCRRSRTLLLLAAAATLTRPYVADAETWDNSSGDGQWSTASNWLDDTEPNGSEVCIFPSPTPGSQTVTLSSGEQAAGLDLRSLYTLTGGSLTLLGGATIVTTTGAFATINSDLAGSAGLHISNAAQDANSGVTLGGNNSFTGAVTLNGSRVGVNSNVRFGNAANTVQVTSALLELTGGATIDRALTISTVTNQGILRSTGGVATSLGMINVPSSTAQLSTTFATDELNIGAPTNTGPVPITGSGTISVRNVGIVRLNGVSCNFAGSWVVSNAGTFDVGSDVKLGGTSNAVTLSNGGTIIYNVNQNVLRTFTMNGGGVNTSSGVSTFISISCPANGGFTKTGAGVVRLVAQAYGTGSTINVNGGTVHLLQNAQPAFTVPSITFNVNSGGIFSTNVTNTLEALNVADGGLAQLTVGGITLQVNTLSIPGTGTLDLLSDKLIVKNAAGSGGLGSWNGSAYTGLTGRIASGRNGGAWNGGGIVTTMSDANAATALTTLAIATAGSVSKTSFGGTSVAASDVLVMYTYAGDANLSGKIDGDDFARIDAGFSGSFSGYINGDFNYSGKVDADDYWLIDRNYSRNLPAIEAGPIAGATADSTSSLQAVPEPGGVGLAIGVLAAAVGRRRRVG